MRVALLQHSREPSWCEKVPKVCELYFSSIPIIPDFRKRSKNQIRMAWLPLEKPLHRLQILHLPPPVPVCCHTPHAQFPQTPKKCIQNGFPVPWEITPDFREHRKNVVRMAFLCPEKSLQISANTVKVKKNASPVPWEITPDFRKHRKNVNRMAFLCPEKSLQISANTVQMQSE